MNLTLDRMTELAKGWQANEVHRVGQLAVFDEIAKRADEMTPYQIEALRDSGLFECLFRASISKDYVFTTDPPWQESMKRIADGMGALARKEPELFQFAIDPLMEQGRYISFGRYENGTSERSLFLIQVIAEHAPQLLMPHRDEIQQFAHQSRSAQAIVDYLDGSDMGNQSSTPASVFAKTASASIIPLPAKAGRHRDSPSTPRIL
jgi:hypothetical protein